LILKWTHPTEIADMAIPSCPVMKLLQVQEEIREDHTRPTICSGVVSHLRNYVVKTWRPKGMTPYNSAKPDTQIMDEPVPCKMRAMHISQYVGASMSIT
jgi:hypothetical protein